MKTLLKQNDFVYKDIWVERKKSSPKLKKTPKTKKIEWDGPHQDKFIPGVAKEYKGKRISTLEDAKRISIELGDKSTGFTKKKFYSIRNGKTLRKAVGEVSWIKLNPKI